MLSDSISVTISAFVPRLRPDLSLLSSGFISSSKIALSQEIYHSLLAGQLTFIDSKMLLFVGFASNLFPSFQLLQCSLKNLIEKV